MVYVSPLFFCSQTSPTNNILKDNKNNWNNEDCPEAKSRKEPDTSKHLNQETTNINKIIIIHNLSFFWLL